jgi:hypothetical protein
MSCVLTAYDAEGRWDFYFDPVTDEGWLTEHLGNLDVPTGAVRDTSS